MIHGYDDIVASTNGKSSILHRLIDQIHCSRAIFIEDRIDMLTESIQYFELTNTCKIEFVLAGWGYNTIEERDTAALNKNVIIWSSWSSCE